MTEQNRAQTLLAEILEADAAALAAHEKLRKLDDQRAVAQETVARLRQELKSPEPDPGAELAIQRLLEICTEIQDENTTSAIVHALDHPDPLIRDVASDAATTRAFERYAEVAHAFNSGTLGPLALQELCFVFVNIGEPSSLKLVSSLLQHENAEVAAAAIEALTQYGDPKARKSIEALLGDSREVTLEHADEEFVATIGELAQEALEELAKGNR